MTTPTIKILVTQKNPTQPHHSPQSRWVLLAPGAKAPPSTPSDEAICLCPLLAPQAVSGFSMSFTALLAKNKAQTDAALSSSTRGFLLKGENRHIGREEAGKWRRWRPEEGAKGGWRTKWKLLDVEKVEQGCVEDRQETPGLCKRVPGICTSSTRLLAYCLVHVLGDWF